MALFKDLVLLPVDIFHERKSEINHLELRFIKALCLSSPGPILGTDILFESFG